MTLLKIDVEGMERAVMQGAAERIAKDRPILYFENDRPETYFENVAWVEEQFGYRVFQHLAPLYDPQNFRGNAENIFGDIVSGNCVAVPHGSPLIPLLEAQAEHVEIAA